MRQIIACQTTFSEGARSDVIDALAGAAGRSGARVVDVRLLPGRGSVEIAWIGESIAVERGLLAAAAIARDAIDVGAHAARDVVFGATDRVVLSPLSDTPIAACVDVARRAARQLATDLGTPVYLLGEAALQPERRELAALSVAGAAALASSIAEDPGLAPDLGPRRLGPAGAIVVCVAPPRVALDLDLVAEDGATAAAIAAALDGASGGLAGVRATAGPGTGDRFGVAVVVDDVARTPLPRVVELARREAERRGARLVRGAIRGPVAAAALQEAACWYLGIDPLGDAQVVEDALAALQHADPADDLVPRRFLDAVASDEPTPAGSAAAALAGALAAALVGMVAGLTVGKPRYASVEHEMQRLRHRAADIRQALLELIAADRATYETVVAAYKLPRDTADDADRRRDAVQVALRRATDAPLTTMRAAVDVLRLARDAAGSGNANAASDAGVAAYLALGAAQGAALILGEILVGIRDFEEGDRFRRASSELLVEARALLDEVDRMARDRRKG